jgi:hypothetical protein
MGRRIQVRAVAKEEPDTYLYVLALIELARQLQEEAGRPAVSPRGRQTTRQRVRGCAHDGS